MRLRWRCEDGKSSNSKCLGDCIGKRIEKLAIDQKSSLEKTECTSSLSRLSVYYVSCAAIIEKLLHGG